MLAKPILSQMTQDFGIDVFNVPEEDLPETVRRNGVVYELKVQTSNRNSVMKKQSTLC